MSNGTMTMQAIDANASIAADSITMLPVSKIRKDGATQPRDVLSNETIIDYADLILEGAQFPPLVVFHDGTHYWLADGFHRHAAYMRAKVSMVSCDVRMGEKRDALLYSCGANSNHGLRRTNADKRRGVMKLLNDDEWGTWTDRRIADICGVTPGMVSACRVHAVNPSARSNFRKSMRNGQEIVVDSRRKAGEAKEAVVESSLTPSVVIPPLSFVPPAQRTSENPIHKYAKQLKAADVRFRQDVETGFGRATFETDEALIQIVPVLSASSLRDAAMAILVQRRKHCPAKKAVIVGQIMDDARPWIAEIRHWKVEIKSIG